MTLYECPRCGNETATNSKVGGAFDLPPNLYCVHGDEAVEMNIVNEADISEDAKVDA